MGCGRVGFLDPRKGGTVVLEGSVTQAVCLMGFQLHFSRKARVDSKVGSGWRNLGMLRWRCNLRLLLEESSIWSTSSRRVYSFGAVGARSDTGIGVPVAARNLFEGLFLGS